MEDKQEKKVVCMAAINPVKVTNIVSPEEVENSGREYVFWGKNNDYPEYLRSLAKNAATLKSILRGCVQYSVGNKIECIMPYQDEDGKRYMNREKHSAEFVLANLFYDLHTYGGFCYEVIRSAAGDIVEIYYIDIRFIRTNKENTVFWYSEDWKKRWGKKTDIQYPKFHAAAKEVAESIVYYKNSASQVYPESPFEAATIAAQLEHEIDVYHLNSMENGFAGSYVINFNNGVPTDEVKDEIERDVNKKFSGFQNANRILLSFNNSRESMVTVQELKTSDFGEKYQSLAKRSRQQLFTAYRANPNIFGIPTENIGFSKEEYDSAFKLFNRTVIQPAQRTVLDSLEAVYPFNFKITPFSLDGDVEETQTAE